MSEAVRLIKEVDFQFFPSCFMNISASEDSVIEYLSILSQLLRWGCGWGEAASGARLSILSQLLHGRASSDYLEPLKNFQFFPSCFGCGRWLRAVRSVQSFNSFPVASEGFVPGLAYKLFLLPSEVCKTASHPFATH